MQKRTLITIFILIGILISIVFLNKNTSVKEISKTNMYFDTVITITLYDAKESYIDECFQICQTYEKLFHPNLKDSDVSKINQKAGTGEYVSVDRDTLELIETGIRYSKLSNGSFDITLGKLSSLWGFDTFSKTGGKTSLPDESEITSVVSNIGYEQIEIKDQMVRLINKDAKLDLGGIAKGYVADKLKDYLKSKDVKHGIINLGGNILLIGTKPDKSNYHIGIQKPFSSTRDYIRIVDTKDKSIVTSGIYERYYEIDGKIYHHILDAKTGYPVENELASVTIISDKSVDGDALSTLIFTKGLEDGMEIINNTANIEAVFITKKGRVILSQGIKDSEGIISSLSQRH